MQATLAPSLQSLSQKALPFALSFLDDAIILAVSHLGLNLPWLHSLQTVLPILSALYWGIQIARFCSQRLTACPH